MRSTAAHYLRKYLETQSLELNVQGPRVRRNEIGSVHDLRVATRRLRSVLSTFRLILDRPKDDPLREELKWLMRALGDARDVEVMHARIIEMIADEPPGPSLDMVRRRIDAALNETLGAAHVGAIAALDSSRYSDLLNEVNALVTETPWTDITQPPSVVFPPLVRREWKRLLRDATVAEQAVGHRERLELLHEVRKSAKRARCAAEVVKPVYGGNVTNFLKAVTLLQTVLGDLQDSVVTQQGIERLGAQAHLNGENAFTYGRLHAREQARAAHTEENYALAWKNAADKKLRAWLRP